MRERKGTPAVRFPARLKVLGLLEFLASVIQSYFMFTCIRELSECKILALAKVAILGILGVVLLGPLYHADEWYGITAEVTIVNTANVTICK
jgi:hypothetical protein